MEKEIKSQKGDLEYFLIHDYEMAKQWLADNETSGNLKIAKNIDRQFMIGMTVTGDFDKIKVFFSCLQKEIVDLYEIGKVRNHSVINS
jgi:hypothetical protein